jgi:3-hydroxyisobutyrate dehydrogenase
MKIGFIGLGIMGESMALNIIKKHDDRIFVYDIDKSKIDQLAAEGAVATASPEELAENADVVISMVPTSKHSEQVYDRIIPILNSSKICIDMSTIAPSASIAIAARVKATGAAFIDAPVVKSKPAAIAGQLGIYVGGDKAVFEKVRPILLYMGCNVIHLGGNGKGLVMKIAHNTLVAQIQNGVNEMLSFAGKNGIGVDDFVTSVSYGGAQNFYLDTKNQAIKNHDFTTAFSVENMHKDVTIGVEMLRELGMGRPGMTLVKDIYDKAMANGLGKQDFSATYTLFE